MAITKTSYGYLVTTAGVTTVAEVKMLRAEFDRLQPGAGSFGIVADPRDQAIMPADVQATMNDLAGHFVSRGLTRIAAVCSSNIVAMQQNRLVNGTPAAAISRAFDGKAPAWEAKALTWVVDGR